MMTELNRIPKVAIVVLNWNSYADTTECLDSLRDLEYENYFVIMVDNGSSDGSGEQIARKYGWVEGLINKKNLGFAAGNNIGIRKALMQGAEYVLLMNNDTLPERDFLSSLVDTAEANERTAIVSGVQYLSSGEIEYAGGEIHPYLGLKRLNPFLGTVEIWDEPKSTDRPYRTEFVGGSLMLLDREFLQECGGLNEAYFFRMEDIDISYRALKRGMKMRIDPDAKVVHKGGESWRDNEGGYSFQKYHQTRNKITFARENHGPIGQLIYFFVYFFLHFPGQLTKDAVMGRFNLVGARLLGLIDMFMRSEVRKPEQFER